MMDSGKVLSLLSFEFEIIVSFFLNIYLEYYFLEHPVEEVVVFGTRSFMP